MAWCGADITLARVGPSGHSQLARMGVQHHHYSCDVPSQQWEKMLHTPQMWPLSFEVVQVAFSSSHFAVVTASGRLYTAGWNDRGQLGRANASCQYAHALARVSLPRGAAESVACGPRNMLVVFKQATGVRSVFGCGCNCEKQLPGDADGVGDACGEPPAVHGHRQAVGCSGRHRARRRGSGLHGVRCRRHHRGDGHESARNACWQPMHRLSCTASRSCGCQAPCRRLLPRACRRRRQRAAACVGLGRQQMLPARISRRVPGAVRPTEIVFGCPQLPSNDFSSMLAAWDRHSVIMVNGNVWTCGEHDHTTSSLAHLRELANATCRVQQIDPAHFDNLPVAHVSVGKRHAAFVTTCGRLYVRGFSGKRNEFHNGNGLPTGVRESRRGVVGLCRQTTLVQPVLVPAKVLGDRECGVTRMCDAKRWRFAWPCTGAWEAPAFSRTWTATW